MRLPTQIKDQIQAKLWTIAEELGWSALSGADRSRYYEMWTKDSDIGGKLGHFMDPRTVRVYIKDTLLKSYERSRLQSSASEIFALLKLGAQVGVEKTFIKPHGVLLNDGRIICWGKSRDWKLVLMAAFERMKRQRNSAAYAVVLMETGKTIAKAERVLVSDAAKNLGIQVIKWVD